MAPAQGCHAQIEKCEQFSNIFIGELEWGMHNVGPAMINPMSVTVAILAQGTHWAVADMQAFYK